MLGFTGTYKGKPVSVQTTGMGCPSASIVTEELVQLGAKNLLRVGTCGGYDADLQLGDLIVATAATPQEDRNTSELQSRQYLVCRLLLEKKTNHDAVWRHIIVGRGKK